MSSLKLTSPPTRTAASVLEGAAQLAPFIEERAARIEADRTLPTDVLDALRAAGCFRILHPTSHGGCGADLGSAFAMFETLARADASTAWTVMIGSGAWIDLASLPRSSFDALFPDDGDLVVAGAFNPTGSMAADGDGYRVDGRWGFASGCRHATWLYGNCIEGFTDDGPQLRIAVFAPAQVVIEDTWDVAGLRGTGSHHFRVEGLLVPRDLTCDALHGEPSIDEPFVRCPVPAVFALGIAAVALGIGRAAVDDVIGFAPSKVPLLAATPLAESPSFQEALARADTELRAARALLHEAAASTWATATGGGEFTLRDRGALRATAAWVVERAVTVVDVAHRAGGGGAIYADCALQRRLRDVQTLRQHFLVRADTFATAGAILTGGQPEVPVF
jgi:indole-3-acetate monooxygenase